MMTLLVAVVLAFAAPAAVPTPGGQYAGTWAWCGDRFPGQPELQEACRWGAFEMLPGAPVETEWRA